MKIPSVVLCASLLAAVSLPAESLQDILARMDEASLTFKAVTADVQMITYTKIIDDKTNETGSLKMQREKDKSTRAIIEFTGENDARVIYFAGSLIRIYYPKLKLYQDFDVGKNSEVLNQYLLLGFGSSGKELLENYDITNGGSETIAGQQTTKLSLVPKSDKVKNTLIKIDVWVPQGMSYPIQQKFFKPSGDYFTTQYTNVKFPAIKGTLEFKLPKGATKQGS